MSNSKNKTATKAASIESLVEALSVADKGASDARKTLIEALSEVELGHVVQIDGMPEQVVEDDKGKRNLVPMLTKRQIAAVKGLPVPPIKRRGPRTPAATSTSDKAAE